MIRDVQRMLLVLLGVVVLGTLGFITVEGWGFLDSLYMTIITVTTVGFQEVRTLEGSGRVLTIILAVSGFTVMTVWMATLTTALVEREFRSALARRRMQKVMNRMNGHTILCGAGRTGQEVIREFRRMGRPLIVIENDPGKIEVIKSHFPKLLYIEGDATKDETLTEANVEHAQGLIATLSRDTDNLFVTISARSLNPNVMIVARALETTTESKLLAVGATHVISPKVTEATRMASMILRPSVVSFLDAVTKGDDITLLLEEVEMSDSSLLRGKPLVELEIPQRTGLIVLAIRQGRNRKIVFNPTSSTVVEAGDCLVVLGEADRIDGLKEHLDQSVVDL